MQETLSAIDQHFLHMGMMMMAQLEMRCPQKFIFFLSKLLWNF